MAVNLTNRIKALGTAGRASRKVVPPLIRDKDGPENGGKG
jgi:hypothetical protein